MSRIGIFGGSFDPIHLGHLVLADQCREQLNLDEIRFMPAFISPLKQHAAPMDSKHRIEMIRLAIEGNRFFAIDTREIQRQGVSFTVDSLRSIKEELPESELFLLMGADSVKDLSKWRSPGELLELASIGAIKRSGAGEPDWDIVRQFVSPARLESFHRSIETPSLEISSTDLRRRIAQGRTTRYLLPAAVEEYIKNHGLYRV